MSYRFAIIGCGNIASRHAEQVQAVGELVGLCDTNASKADYLAERYQVKAYYDHQLLLHTVRPDIVVVCTPNGLHPLHAINALQAGCDVLCEKPMAITVGDAQKMTAIASLSGKRLFVVKQNRYNPPVVEVKRLLDEGKLGKISGFQVNCIWNRPPAYYKDSWRGTRELDGGLLFTQFSHFIDILYWFLGEIDQVSGFRSNYLHRDCVDFEDSGTANIIMKNGAMGNIYYTINAHKSNMEGSLTLIGNKGTVRIGGQYLNRIDYFSVQNEILPVTGSGNPPNSYNLYKGSMSNHPAVYQELIRALNDPAHPVVEASEAMKSIEMIQQIYASSPFVHFNETHEQG